MHLGEYILNNTLFFRTIVWRGAKETAEFCRFWRFSVSATHDWNGYNCWVFVATHFTPYHIHITFKHITIVHIRCQFCIPAFALWLHLVLACFSFFLLLLLYIYICVYLLLACWNPKDVLVRSFLLAEIRPPTLYT